MYTKVTLKTDFSVFRVYILAASIKHKKKIKKTLRINES